MDTNNARLDGYFANVSRRKNSVSDWRIYAAVTGSAMAMATNASAGVIYFNQAVTVGPVGNVGAGAEFTTSQNTTLKSGNVNAAFRIGVRQSSGFVPYRYGNVFLADGGKFEVLTANSKVKQLAFGANISTVHGLWKGGTNILASFHKSKSASVPELVGWAANATGLAGFRVSTANDALDYGWVRLSYTLGTNGLANSITATDWAYDPTGAPVTAGETASSATPEPSTTALAILAAGAAGVAALRRRRYALSQ